VASLRARLDAVDQALAGIDTRPSVFVAEWLDPPFAAGHWVPEMIARGGGREVLGRAGEPSFRTTWHEVRERQPEACILAPCGFDVERTLAELRGLDLAGALRGTPALRDGAVYAVDATSYFSRPGPRLVDGVELCAALLHPGHVPDPSAPGAWERVTP
jgi:iron complex transport system substrate-binding protein